MAAAPSGGRDNRLPGILAVVSFAVATAALLVAVAGLHAFEARNPLPPGGLEADFTPEAAMGNLYVTSPGSPRPAW